MVIFPTFAYAFLLPDISKVAPLLMVFFVYVALALFCWVGWLTPKSNSDRDPPAVVKFPILTLVLLLIDKI